MNESGIKFYVQLLGWTNEAAETLNGEHKKWAVFLIGPPGSGKGTQADLLAQRFGLVHVQTSKLGEEKINDQELVKNDPEIAEIKRLYDKGELFPPPWTVKIVLEKAQELADQGKGIIFSGSPRTIYEIENELPYFENLFGKENIKVINLKIEEGESINRNSHRRVCQANGHPIPNFEQFKNIQTCPQDGSPIITRSLDTPDTTKTRNEVYHKRTEPIFAFLKEKGHNIIEINGEQAIDKVFQDILAELDR
ncbi:MAG: nucleoside monophosphate kinase [Candidatus Paceibacterota bacterium]